MNLSRHRRHLLPGDLVRKAPPPDPETAKTLLERIENLILQARSIARCAEVQQQWMAATSALREVRACLELLGKMSGEIAPASYNYNAFNFVNASNEQIRTFLERADPRVKELLAQHLRQSSMPGINVNFVAVAERCPKCGDRRALPQVLPPLPSTPTNGNGHA